MQKKKDFNNIERKLIVNTKDYDPKLPHDEYHRTIRVPSVDERYRNITLLSASISNTFPTIQLDINNYFKIHIHGEELQIDPDSGKIDPLQTISYDNNIRIPLGYYSEDEILNVINEGFLRRFPYIKDDIILPNELIDPAHVISINRKNKLDLDYKIKYVFKSHEAPIPQKFIWVEDIWMELPNNIFKLFGEDHRDIKIVLWKKKYDESEITYTKVINGIISNPQKYEFPCRPTLISVSQLQIRFDTVNQDEDSNVLANIPIERFEEPYIVYNNPNPKLTARRIGYHQNDLITISLSQEDGYGISLDEVTLCLEILIF